MEWVIKITHFLVCGPVSGIYFRFVKGIFYAAKTLRGVVEMDTWTGLPLTIRKDYRRLCVYPLDLLDRKVIMYPADSSRTSSLVVDPLTIKSVYVPKG